MCSMCSMKVSENMFSQVVSDCQYVGQVISPKGFSSASYFQCWNLNPLPCMPILDSSISAANKKYDVKNMDKWGTII